MEAAYQSHHEILTQFSMGINGCSKSVDIAPLQQNSHSSVMLILFECEIHLSSDNAENMSHLSYDTDPIDDKSPSSTDSALY